MRPVRPTTSPAEVASIQPHWRATPGDHSTAPPPQVADGTPRRIRDKWVIVQDNDPKHKTDESMQLLGQLFNNRLFEHPSNSPDFNVMEDAWSYLDRMVKKCNIRTIQGLKKRLTQLWNELPWDYIRQSVDSMPARLQRCLNIGVLE